MKDNISIIFTAIIGTFLIVLLPLYSILDRQDSMSYNVVLTSTTNFVDNIRNNGFVDRESYYNYISALASTSNTYKVTLEAYRKTLIHETDEFGNIIPDSYIEEIELYNTQDILEVLEGETEVGVENSNEKNNVYLFDVNDEIYVKVYNTNITAGSVIYNVVAGDSNSQVINVSYGGVVNKVNWELYDKIQAETALVPEVTMTVPVNGRDELNLKKINSNGEIVNIDCTNEEVLADETLKELCTDEGEYILNQTNLNVYLYDLNGETIGIQANLLATDEITIPSFGTYTVAEIYESELRDNILNKINEYISTEYISRRDIQLSLVKEDEENYTLEILLTNVKIDEKYYLSNSASLAIASGLSDKLTGTVYLGTTAAQVNSESGDSYTYLYDLSAEKNKTIKVLVELKRINKINTGKNEEGTEIYTPLSKLQPSDFEETNGEKSAIEKYIVDEQKYIQLNGMDADINLKLVEPQDNPYYYFEIELTNVRMSEIDYISTLASIIILPGLGQDENGTLSMGGETIEIELTDPSAVNTLVISKPHIWQKLLKTKNKSDAIISSGVVYSNVEIAFIISYTGINGYTYDEIVQAIRENLKVYITDSEYSDIEIITEQEMNEIHKINLSTDTAGHVVAKFKYTAPNNSKNNYIELTEGWITTNANDEPEEGIPSAGAKSSEYAVKLDDLAPNKPGIIIEGTKGANAWYTSNVELFVDESADDESGIYRHTITIEGAGTKAEEEITEYTLEAEGISYVIVRAYDYAGNVSETREEIKIDKTVPTAPVVSLTGTEGTNGWYTSDVKFVVTPGTDAISGIDRTKYTIEGANKLSDELEALTGKVTKEGKSTVIATTYDKAGNKTETRIDVYIDKSTPPDATIEVIQGEKNSPDIEWYYTDVTLKITVDATDSISGLGTSSYRITGSSEVPTTQFEGAIKEITITENGTHNITVYTYTVAGNFKETKYTVQIDKDAPNTPTVTLSGTEGENSWYTSNVEVTVTSNGDVGTSVEKGMTYKIIENGIEPLIETEIANNGKIFFNDEGEYILKVYSRDMALNKVEVEKVIKIDKTNPTSAEFVIEGTKGVDDWYISDVTLSHQGAQDSISGIQGVTLSTNSITENTAGTNVTLTTKDYAGNTVTKEIIIKIDKDAPTKPVITLGSKPTGDGFFGALMYNHDVEVTITPGEDYFLPNIDNLDRTTYEVTTNNGSVTLIPETEGTNLKITYEGIITITARTYDKAGNVSYETEVLMINKSKPSTPRILSINGTNVEGTSSKEVTSTSNTITLEIGGVTEGNDVKIILTNQTTYEETEITETAIENTPIQVQLTEKGSYSIKVTQTNMYGTESDMSTEYYTYTYQ